MKGNDKKHDSISDSVLTLRRCHCCDFVTELIEEKSGLIKACGGCRKSLAPFYFFVDQDVVAHSDTELRPERVVGEVRPVLGFTAHW